MKPIATILILLAVTPAINASAEEATNANHNVPYKSNVPSQIRKYARTIRATRFYGETVIQGQNVALHFYDVQPIKKLNDEFGRQKSQLDVFIKGQRRGTYFYKRANKISLYCRQWLVGEPTIQMDVMWLDPVQQTKPIIKLRATKQVSSGGMTGNDILVTFPKGLGAKAVTQVFGSAFYKGPTGASSNKFDKVDKNGFITILNTWVDSRGDEYTAYKWDGSKFSKYRTLLDWRVVAQ